MNGRSKRTGEESCDGLLSDRQLLGRFADHGDDEAFAELVSRYCGLVLGVCRRTLGDEHSAEDAFQATFLVLARRASQIRNRSALAGWLYAVAYRTARRAKAKRHQRREEALRDDMTETDDILARVTSRYEQQLLDDELNRLPPKYREPLVFRYLMGKSNKQIAGELGLSVGVVEGRLKRGKDRLRLRLAKRGISLTIALAGVGASATVLEAATTNSLVAATVQAAAAFRTGAPPAGQYSQNTIQLAEKELAMSTSTVAATTSGLATILVVAGLALGWPGDGGQQPAQAQDPTLAAAAPEVLPAVLPAEGGGVPVRLAVAEKGKRGPDPKSALTSAEKRIEEALDGPATLEFLETPLLDVANTIADLHGINVLIDTRALEDVGIPSDCPITFELRDVSLQSGLNLLLRPLDLTWTIRDEVLLITTPEEAEMMLIVKVYDVGDLVRCQDKSGEQWADYDTLIEVIKTTVKPDTWDDVGGAGSIAPAPFRGVEMLVISQICQVHQHIEQLLEQFRAIAEKSGTGEIPFREKPKPPPKTIMAMGSPGVPEQRAPDAGAEEDWLEPAEPDARGKADLPKVAAPRPRGKADLRKPATPDSASKVQPTAPAPSGEASAEDSGEVGALN